MVRHWLSYIVLAIVGLSLAFIAGGAYYYFSRPHEIQPIDVFSVKRQLPINSFAQKPESYQAIDGPFFSLKAEPLAMHLPDLKKNLVYHGKNGRPDAQLDRILMNFSFNGNKSATSLQPGQKHFVLYNRKLIPPQYVFSAQNAETPLWIEVKDQGAEALVHVYLKNENGEIIQEPSHLSEFSLPEKENLRLGAMTAWDIGKWRVDGSLLARQKGRWYGPDRFLERHGGSEFQHVAGKQRLDFGDGEDVYSVYISLGDSLIWKNDRWHVVQPGPESLNYPLMTIKKIDERLMTLELWDVEGKAKMTLNLLKSHEAMTHQNIAQSFKFLGSRTRSQFVFEINKERMLLSPKDWLLLTDKGWKKLVTPEEIDAYVERRLNGQLFVFDDVVRKEDKQLIVGTLFNPSRTETHSIEISISQNGAVKAVKNPTETRQIAQQIRVPSPSTETKALPIGSSEDSEENSSEEF